MLSDDGVSINLNVNSQKIDGWLLFWCALGLKFQNSNWEMLFVSTIITLIHSIFLLCRLPEWPVCCICVCNDVAFIDFAVHLLSKKMSQKISLLCYRFWITRFFNFIVMWWIKAQRIWKCPTQLIKYSLCQSNRQQEPWER